MVGLFCCTSVCDWLKRFSWGLIWLFFSFLLELLKHPLYLFYVEVLWFVSWNFRHNVTDKIYRIHNVADNVTLKLNSSPPSPDRIKGNARKFSAVVGGEGGISFNSGLLASQFPRSLLKLDQHSSLTITHDRLFHEPMILFKYTIDVNLLFWSNSRFQLE